MKCSTISTTRRCPCLATAQSSRPLRLSNTSLHFTHNLHVLETTAISADYLVPICHQQWSNGQCGYWMNWIAHILFHSSTLPIQLSCHPTFWRIHWLNKMPTRLTSKLPASTTKNTNFILCSLNITGTGLSSGLQGSFLVLWKQALPKFSYVPSCSSCCSHQQIHDLFLLWHVK